VLFGKHSTKPLYILGYEIAVAQFMPLLSRHSRDKEVDWAKLCSMNQATTFPAAMSKEFVHYPNQDYYRNNRIDYYQNRISHISPANIICKWGLGQKELKSLARAGEGNLLPAFQDELQD
jgi:hypothetical protein